MTEKTYGRLRAIRMQKSWSIEQAVTEALTLLETELKAVARSAVLTEMHKREEEARHGSSLPAKSPKKSRKPKPQPEPEEVDGQGSLL